MLLYESNYNYLNDYFIRVFDTDTNSSKTIEIPKKWEYYLPCDSNESGLFTAIRSKIHMKKYEGYWKDTKDSYSPFSPVDRYIRDNFWKKAYNENPRVWYIDIETRVTLNEFPSPDKAAEQISLMQIYDSFLNKIIILGYKDFKFEPGYEFDVDVKYIKCSDECDMINKYLGIFKKLNPLIIYAWNGNGFDFPYIANRFAKYGFNSSNLSNYNCGKLKEITGSGGRRIWELHCNGHYYIDLMDVYKKFTFKNMPSYSLDYISSYELKDVKVKHDEFNDFDSFYTGKNYTISEIPYDDKVREQIRQLKIKEKNKELTEKDKERLNELISFQFVYYGIKDVILLRKIDECKKFTSVIVNIAQTMGCSLDDTLGTIKPWSIGLKNMFYENNFVSDTRFSDNKDDVNIVGGYVRDPIVGIHEWILSEDVNSMYPMLSMKGFNMSPETYIAIKDLPDDLRNHILKYYNDQNESKILNYSDEIKNKTKYLLKKYNYSMAINGAVFNKAYLGIVPKIVSEIYFGRKKDKKEMLNYEQQIVNINEIIESNKYGFKTNEICDKIYTKEELKEFSKESLQNILNNSEINATKLDTKQVTKKVLINALYGALGNIYFSLFNQYIAQAITGNGRLFIQIAANNVEKYLQSICKSNKPYIIYGDTDSCVGDTVIETKRGRTTIERFYDETSGNESLYTNNSFVKKPYRKLYVKSLSNKLEVEFKPVKYIMKHIVKKRMFKIKTHGREVIITEDHSVMVIRDNALTSVKPKDILKSDKIIFIGNFDNYKLSDEDRKIFETKSIEVDKYFSKNGYSTQALWKTYIPCLIKQNFKDDWIERCLKLKEIGISTASRDKWILLYGESEGDKKYEEYRKRQAYTNSQEYKNMSDEEFKKYNKSRAVTKESFIKKYGENDGIKLWNSYRERQGYTNTLEYFIEQYGENEGTKVYEKINKLKSHTLESYMMRFDDKNKAFEMYKNFWETSRGVVKNYSNQAYELFKRIEKDLNIEHCYYAPKTKEFGLYCHETNSYMFYDFVIPNKKICIEYNGNCFHANPKIYKEDDHPNPFNKEITSKEIWESDKIKINNIEKYGYNVIIVWENNYNYDDIKMKVKELMV